MIPFGQILLEALVEGSRSFVQLSKKPTDDMTVPSLILPGSTVRVRCSFFETNGLRTLIRMARRWFVSVPKDGS